MVEEPAIRRTTGQQFIVTTLSASVGVFLGWCLGDFVVVRLLDYPEQAHVLDKPLLFGLPTAALIFAWIRLRDAGLAIGCAVVSCAFGAVLIAFLGIPFHFAIGGQL